LTGQEVTHILATALETPAPLSLADLRGLGADVWKDIDASAHVEAERRTWD
jgi:hypothetical protein